MYYQEKSVRNKLLSAGLRPTKQRLLIGDWLFNGEDRHFTAEDLHQNMITQGGAVSLATIYNTLGTFVKFGLLHTVNVDISRVFYDTNTRPHYHMYDVDNHALTDIEIDGIEVNGLPMLPKGQELERVDVIIRTRSET